MNPTTESAVISWLQPACLPAYQLVILYMEEYLISFYVLVFLLDLLVLGLPIQGGVADLLVLAGALQAGGLQR